MRFQHTSNLSTNPIAVPTNHSGGNSEPQNTLSLSEKNISNCITSMSSLNLTVENELTISYYQHTNPRISRRGYTLTTSITTVNPLDTEFKRKLPQSPDKIEAGHPPSQASEKGRCSVLTEVPPGKVLSILFLNQTCSRDNEVRVQDNHDGWSTTLDGCSPWKSPGYDVTTADRSAFIVIDLHNLVDFFRLEVQIKGVHVTDGFITHYVSHVLGYIQTPGWHPFARPFSGATNAVVVVKVPRNHVALITTVYIYVACFQLREQTELITVRKSCNQPQREWSTGCVEKGHAGAAVNHADITEFRVQFKEAPGYSFYGARVLFSFHEPFLAPQQQPDGLWNCSSPSWPDFHQHFVCNNKTECAGREDEMWCPDISCQQGGMLLNERCYIFLSLPKGENTWFHANAACKQRGAALASFPTVNSWYDMALLSQTIDHHCRIYIGMQSSHSSYPHMYRYLLQWYNGSISHYAAVRFIAHPPYCVYHAKPCFSLQTKSCTCKPYFLSYALCLAGPSNAVNIMSRIRSVQRPRKTEQIQSKVANIFRTPFPFASIACPDGHRTQDFLACDAFSACWLDKVRSSDVNVTTGSGKASVFVGVDVITTCKALFPCQNGANSVPYSLVCNHLQDCADNSDEKFCVFPPCSAGMQFKCANGQCLEYRYWCDEFVQCVDESDEVDCVPSGMPEYTVRPRPPAVANFDGRGFMVYTPTAKVMGGSAVVCPDTHVFCPGEGYYCLPVYVRCNGVYDCPSREDEDDCNSHTCPGLYRCRGLLNTCLHPDHLCDGWPQCPQHDDEQFCNLTCPVNCTCLGHAFTCTSDLLVELFPSLRYLDASGTGLKPGRLVKNTMLVYLSLAHCDLTHLDNLTLPNLLSLDLSDNRLIVVTVAELNLMKNLQNLSLARNVLSSLFSGNYSSGFPVHENILYVDLTGVELSVLDMSSSLPFPSLLSLNLSECGVTHLIGDGFRSLTSLRILDLRGCPMTIFPRRVLKDLNNLHQVFTENYKLCCETNLPTAFSLDNCQAPFNEISSCVALLRADVYRVCLSVLAALALSGNVGCLSLRLFSLTGRGKTGFNVFVTHLCVSDFAMGVYMAMIGVADRMYMGSYLWEEDRWRSSAACQVAGVLALLSSEVSAFIICLITLDRFLVIRFPFSQLRFSSFSAQVASLLAWTVGIVLVTIPLLPVTAYEQFYGQTGICVPLPITRNDFAGHKYAFGIMTLLNLMIFLMIAAGQISVYLSMTSNAMSSIDTTRKSRDLIVARRLITVVVSDFVCWFPIGLLGVLAAQGVPVPGVVNVAIAVFVLPLNSAMNPFLYTVNMIQEKRQRTAEVKLFRLIMDRGINDDENVNKKK